MVLGIEFADMFPVNVIMILAVAAVLLLTCAPPHPTPPPVQYVLLRFQDQNVCNIFKPQTPPRKHVLSSITSRRPCVTFYCFSQTPPPNIQPDNVLTRYGFFQTVFYFGSVSQMCLAFALMCGATA